MTTDDLRALLKRTPFEAFDLKTTDGSNYHITTPDQVPSALAAK